ncbi:MAG: HlyD family secretion protein [Gammaproteobacteria bacterium]|uniref:HlyD family secretion protein n=1 Tax=Bradyrhizobium sp. TaxID=376 RepID=UPI003D129897
MEPPPRRKLKRTVLLLVVPSLATLVALVTYLAGGRYVETDNAYIKADKVLLSAEVSGTVAEVLVPEFATVAAGQPLFRLDRAPFEVAVAKAAAKLAQTRTDLVALKASYREKQTEVAIARTRRAFAVREQRRHADLAAKNFISAASLDEATQGAVLAAQQITATKQDLKRIAATLGGSVDIPIERHPAYVAAQAELEQARLDLARAEVRASLPGTVSNPPKPGKYVAAGSVAMALVVSGAPWIEANFPETDLTHVHPGQPVVIHVDTYPDVTWRGIVESLSPATGAEFAILPAQNATGNWVKITQRLPVRIKLDPTAHVERLRAGLSATVEIDTGHRRRLFGRPLPR